MGVGGGGGRERERERERERDSKFCVRWSIYAEANPILRTYLYTTSTLLINTDK